MSLYRSCGRARGRCHRVHRPQGAGSAPRKRQAVCREFKLPLFLDGARLGYGLVSEGTDVMLADLARLTDVFYIGGTKVGALCGEAVAFPPTAHRHTS